MATHKKTQPRSAWIRFHRAGLYQLLSLPPHTHTHTPSVQFRVRKKSMNVQAQASPSNSCVCNNEPNGVSRTYRFSKGMSSPTDKIQAFHGEVKHELSAHEVDVSANDMELCAHDMDLGANDMDSSVAPPMLSRANGSSLPLPPHTAPTRLPSLPCCPSPSISLNFLAPRFLVLRSPLSNIPQHPSNSAPALSSACTGSSTR